MNRLSPPEFLELMPTLPLVDVRSPSEFMAGHIPGAVNIPLFNDEERAEIGTLYKKVGRDASILRGLEIVGPKMKDFVLRAQVLEGHGELLLHCWRGGMRSANMAWLFELAGMRVHVLEGGYKAYRHHIREKLEHFDRLVILGGKTGSGKTEVLDRIRDRGLQVVNLEKIAHHKGSAFGDLGQDPQPSTEQFENELYVAVAALDPSKFTFVEDESRAIGRVSLPDVFFGTMRESPVIFLDVPKEERIKRLVKEYAGFQKDRLAAAINRISRRLGGLNVKLALEALGEGDYHTVADILLLYYDKAYLKGLSLRDPEKVFHIATEVDDPESNAGLVAGVMDQVMKGEKEIS